MNAPAIASDISNDSQGSQNPVVIEGMRREIAFVVVAIAAFIAGILVGKWSAPVPDGSRIAWPSAESLRPHPRSLEK